MSITLESGPHGTYILRLRERGVRVANQETLLIQTDYDYPSIASTFGWQPRSVQMEERSHCGQKMKTRCDHDGTDGTVDCPCGVTASDFISSAREFLDRIADTGKSVDDPGYFME